MVTSFLDFSPDPLDDGIERTRRSNHKKIVCKDDFARRILEASFRVSCTLCGDGGSPLAGCAKNALPLRETSRNVTIDDRLTKRRIGKLKSSW
jgi:hypothetical protein